MAAMRGAGTKWSQPWQWTKGWRWRVGVRTVPVDRVAREEGMEKPRRGEGEPANQAALPEEEWARA